jgi:hypothetical protein
VWAESEARESQFILMGVKELTHSQVSFHFESWNFDELSNFQRAILGVKTNWIKIFIIPLESS